MKRRHFTPSIENLRALFSVIFILGLILTSLPASPASSLVTRAQEETAVPSKGEWYTYANGDDILVLETENDALWAGTRAGGLIRWNINDGTFIQFLKPQDGLTSNTVRDIYIDAGGNKWLATDHGLSVLDDKGTVEKVDDEWYTYTRESTSGNLPSNRVTATAMDEAGFLWIGTSQYWDHEAEAYVGGGLVKVNTKGNLDPADDEWLQTYNVANTLSNEGGEVLLGLASDNVTDILPLPGNRIWIATQKHWAFREFDTLPGQWLLSYGGFSRLDHAGTVETEDDNWETWTCEVGSQYHSNVSCIVHQLKLDVNSHIWAAMRSRGVITFPSDSGPDGSVVRFDRFDGLATNHVEAIAFGPSDNPQWRNTVWFGTYDASSGAGRGACVLDHNGTVQATGDDAWNNLTPDGNCLTTDQGLPDNRVQAITTGAGQVWMGIGGRFGTGHGISAFDLAQQAVQEPLITATSTLPYNYITDVAVGQAGTRWANHVWFGTGNKREREYGVGALLLNTYGTGDPTDDVWAGFTKGETDLDGSPPWTGLASNNITGLAVDGDDVWFGTQSVIWDSQSSEWTDGGLSVYDGTRWATRTDANTGGDFSGLRDDRTTAVAVGCEGEIWIALGDLSTNAGFGINIFDTMGDSYNRSNDAWQDPIQHPTIPSNLVTEIRPDCARSAIWIATAPYLTANGVQGGGIARYTYSSGGWTSWTTQDGIEAFSEGSTDARVHSIEVEPGGTVWAGTWGKRRMSRQELIEDQPYVPASANWFQEEAWSSQVFEGDGWVSSIAMDETGVVWAGTSRGGMDTDTDGLEDDGLADRAVGGIKFTFDGVEWTTWTPENSPLATNDIEVIEVALDGTVWIGTNGWGVMRFRPDTAPDATPTPTATLTPTTTATPTSTGTPTPSPTPTATPRLGGTIYMPLISR